MPDRTPRDASGWRVLSSPGQAWGRLLGTLGGMFLGAVFLVAAWAKTLDPAAFEAEITGRGLDFLLPAPAVALFALAIEVFLGVALLLGARRPYVLLPTAALVVFFLFLTGQTYYQDLRGTLPEDEVGCGCFGKLVDRTPAEAFWQDLLLMVPALGLAFLGRPRGGAPPRRRLAAAAVLMGSTALLAWKAPDLPLDDLATRLRPGSDPMELCIERAGDGSRVCLGDILPELASGEHVVLLAELDDAVFVEAIDRLNEYTWAGAGPRLWVVTSATEEEIFEFRFGRGPAFELYEAPAVLLRPLYRTLPRSFLVTEARVSETFSGLPPFERWIASEAP